MINIRNGRDDITSFYIHQKDKKVIFFVKLLLTSFTIEMKLTNFLKKNPPTKY
jgi:hypothetical protein